MKKSHSSHISELVTEYRRSFFALIWQKLWKVSSEIFDEPFPLFSLYDGTVLWNQASEKLHTLMEIGHLRFNGVWKEDDAQYEQFT